MWLCIFYLNREKIEVTRTLFRYIELILTFLLIPGLHLHPLLLDFKTPFYFDGKNGGIILQKFVKTSKVASINVYIQYFPFLTLITIE